MSLRAMVKYCTTKVVLCERGEVKWCKIVCASVHGLERPAVVDRIMACLVQHSYNICRLGLRGMERVALRKSEGFVGCGSCMFSCGEWRTSPPF